MTTSTFALPAAAAAVVAMEPQHDDSILLAHQPPQPRVLKSILKSRSSMSSALYIAQPAVSTALPAAPLPPPPLPLAASSAALPPLVPRLQRSVSTAASGASSSAIPVSSITRSHSSSSLTVSLPPLKLTAAELTAAMESIADTLRDIVTHDWTKRIAALQHLISVATSALTAPPSPASSPSSPSLPSLFLSSFRLLRDPLAAQILDLRSSVVKEACSGISIIATTAGPAFSEEADHLLPLLIRLVSVSVQVIATSGHGCITALLTAAKPRAGIARLIDGCSSSSAITRARCMDYVVVWMRRWGAGEEADTEYIRRWGEAVEKLVADKLSDRTESVRGSARTAAVLLGRVWGDDRLQRLLDGQDEKVRRMVQDERKREMLLETAATAAAGGGTSDRRRQQQVRSLKRKSIGLIALEDKENSHPNAAITASASAASIKPAVSLPSPSLPPRPLPAPPVLLPPATPAAPAFSLKGARRTSFTIQSITAVEGETGPSACSPGGGANRLAGAQRIVQTPSAAAASSVSSIIAAAASLPQRARRLSSAPACVQAIVPLPVWSLTSATSPSPSSAASMQPSPASSPPPRPHSPPHLMGPSAAATSASASSSLAEPSVAVSRSLPSDLNAVIDSALAHAAQLQRRRRTHTVAAPVHAAAEEEQAEQENRPPAAAAAAASAQKAAMLKRKSLGAPSSRPAPTKPPRRASFSLQQPAATAAAAPLPVSAVQRPASLTSLLLLTREAQWSTRVSALESITSMLSSADFAPQLDKLMYAVAERMQDAHHRVVAAAISALLALVAALVSPSSSAAPSLLLPHLSSILSSLFLCLSHPRLPIRHLANDALNQLSLHVPHALLLPPLAASFASSSDARVRRGGEEFLLYILAVGDDEERRKNREVVDALGGEVGRRVRKLLQEREEHEAAEETEEPQQPADTTAAQQQEVNAASPSESQPEAKEDSQRDLERKYETREEESTAEHEMGPAVAGAETEAPAALEQEVAASPLPLSLLISPHHPINQPPSLAVLLAPPVLSPRSPAAVNPALRALRAVSPPASSAPSPPVVAVSPKPRTGTASSLTSPPHLPADSRAASPTMAPSSHPSSPARLSERPSPPLAQLIPPSVSAAISPVSAPLPHRSSHRTDAGVHTRSAVRPERQRQHQRSTSLSVPSQPDSSNSAAERPAARKRIAVSIPSLPAPAQPSRPASSGRAAEATGDAYETAVRDGDVSSLIFQWKQAESSVVRHSLRWLSTVMAAQACRLSASSVERIVAALVDVAHEHNALTDEVLTVMGLLLSTSTPSAASLRPHLTAAAFPHTQTVLQLLLSVHHNAAAASGPAASSASSSASTDAVWQSAVSTFHRGSVVSALTALLSSTPPTHRESLTLLLTTLHSLLPLASASSLSPLLPSLSSLLSLLLSHEHVLIRKHSVRCWVCLWESLGDGVERWLQGLGGVGRKLVDIYITKAKADKQEKQQTRKQQTTAATQRA